MRKQLRFLGISLGFFIMAYGNLQYQQYGIMLVFLVLGLVFGGIVVYRITRDHLLIRQAYQPYQQQLPVTKSSPGNRLFVPPPKPRQK